MDSSTHNTPPTVKNESTYVPCDGTGPTATKKWADEFSSWQMTEDGIKATQEIREKFDQLLSTITAHTPPTNGRYLALTKTKLEEACMFAVKGIAKQ